MQATRLRPACESRLALPHRASTAPPLALRSAIGLVVWICAAGAALLAVAVIVILQDLLE